MGGTGLMWTKSRYEKYREGHGAGCVWTVLSASLWISTGSYWEFYCNYPAFFFMEVGTETTCDRVSADP